jgi:hypothetical protein
MQARPGARAWGYVALALWVALVDVWFHGPLSGGAGPPWVALLLAAALGVALVAAGRAWRAGTITPADGVSHAPASVAVVVAALVVASLVRLPALANPDGLISSDSAIAGIIAQELRAGQLPPPIYAPGFPYEGTLKPHLTALLAWLLPGVGTPFLYALSSHLFYLLWTAAVVVLARGLGGPGAAWAAGFYMAVSPRFLTAFSLNNVGQYPEVNALGALALVVLARSRGLLLAGFLLGLALWQQLVAVYFLLAAGLVVALTPALRRRRLLLDGVVGFLAGSCPVWFWNAAHGWRTFDFFRKGGKNPLDRLAGLPDRLDAMASVSFPKLFGLTDVGASGALATSLALSLPLLVVGLVWSRRREIRERRAASPALLVGALFAVVLSVFVVSKYSHRGAGRPRYLIPLYTPVAVAAGWGFVAFWRRSPIAAALAAAAVVRLNAASAGPWLTARSEAQQTDETFVRALADWGVRTGYAGFWIAPKSTFLAEGRFVLSGDLGPDASWVHPGHSARVREAGPDAFILRGDDVAAAFAARLKTLDVRYRRDDISGFVVFHGLSRRVALEEVEGYERGLPAPAQAVADTDSALN